MKSIIKFVVGLIFFGSIVGYFTYAGDFERWCGNLADGKEYSVVRKKGFKERCYVDGEYVPTTYNRDYGIIY